MKIWFAVTFLDFRCTRYIVHHNIAVWVPVERSARIFFNMETTPLQIKTDSTDGSIDSSQVVFWTAFGQVGSIYIVFTDPPKYEIIGCLDDLLNFPDTLPSDVNKIWTISKLPGPRITIKCNDVTVVDILMSDETCDEPDWTDWKDDVKIIQFDYYEDASDEYRPASPGGGGPSGNPLTIFNITFNHIILHSTDRPRYYELLYHADHCYTWFLFKKFVLHQLIF